MKYIVILIGFLVFSVFFLNIENRPKAEYLPISEQKFEVLDTYIQNQLSFAISHLEELNDAETDAERMAIFEASRLAFKKAEPFAALIFPENTLRINGPPLPVFKEDNNKILPPVGYQAIEETIYTSNPDVNVLAYQIKIALGYLKTISQQIKQFPINESRFFPSIHQHFLRIYALGLTGFDTPVSLNGIKESMVCLESIAEVYAFSIQETIIGNSPELNSEFLANIDNAVNYLNENSNFNDFDRYHFARQYLNPLTKNWSEITRKFGYIENRPFALNIEAPTFFEENSFNIDYFRSAINREPSDEKIQLGKLLFQEKALSTSETLSCFTCHQPDNAFQDGFKTGVGEAGLFLERNTPTLINTIFQKSFFWDGRSEELEDQIANVFDNKNEFNANAHAIKTSQVLKDKAYLEKFEKVFPGKSPNRRLIIRAISAYVSTLNAMNSRFDRNMRGEITDFTEEEKRGMNLYMGKALCATCHFVPLTNGTVPPLFLDTEKEVIGVPKTAENIELDTDLGLYTTYKTDIHKFMFKTPTLRNIEFTAPYMHNGVYKTLEEVMDFYNKGGGAGLGFQLEHQTLPFDHLNLTEEEIAAIIAFMKTFSDTNITEQINK